MIKLVLWLHQKVSRIVHSRRVREWYSIWVHYSTALCIWTPLSSLTHPTSEPLNSLHREHRPQAAHNAHDFTMNASNHFSMIFIGGIQRGAYWPGERVIDQILVELREDDLGICAARWCELGVDFFLACVEAVFHQSVVGNRSRVDGSIGLSNGGTGSGFGNLYSSGRPIRNTGWLLGDTKFFSDFFEARYIDTKFFSKNSL